MGMITAVSLEEGVCFGPLPTELMIADPAYLIAQTTADQLSELPTIVANPHRLSDPMRLIEWVCNLRSARNPMEQNVELIRLPGTGQSFYQLTRRVEVGEELFLWFRRWDLNPLLGELFIDKKVMDAWNGELRVEGNDTAKSTAMSSADKFTCGRCADSFTYIYPYVCHVLFKCGRQSVIKSTFHAQSSSVASSVIQCDSTQHTIHTARTDSSTLPYHLLHSSAAQTTIPEEPRAPLIDRQLNYHVPTRGGGKSQLVPGAERVMRKTPFHSVSTHRIAPELDQTRGETYPNSLMNSLTVPLRVSVSHTTAVETPTRSAPEQPRSEVSRARRNGARHSFTGFHHTPKSGNNANGSNLRTRNPLVEQLLQTLGKETLSNPVHTTSSVLSLSQNWCAKCSVSFRLTSDLVQHMRTHHNKTGYEKSGHSDRSPKRHSTGCNGTSSSTLIDEDDDANSMSSDHSRDSSTNSTGCNSCQPSNCTGRKLEEDPAKQIAMISDLSTGKHEPDRLACRLCGEMFRERHHLTRHMISHS